MEEQDTRVAVIARFNSGRALLDQAMRVGPLKDSEPFANTRLYAAIIGIGVLGWGFALYLRVQHGEAAVPEHKTLEKLVQEMDKRSYISAREKITLIELV